jgi:four helix bundle protein
MNFRTYKLAVNFYKESQALKLPRHLKDQLDRASSSIALNLAEGRGRSTTKDQKHFFHIAFGSTRECQAILTLLGYTDSAAWITLDCLAASLYRLIKNAI